MANSLHKKYMPGLSPDDAAWLGSLEGRRIASIVSFFAWEEWANGS
jgi:hypothetical protein